MIKQSLRAIFIKIAFLLGISQLLSGQNISLESLPKGSLRITVVDEGGHPVDHAKVQILSVFKPDWNAKAQSAPATEETGETGIVSATLPTTGTLLFKASKAKYYDAEGQYYYVNHGETQWGPDQGQVTVTLRAIGKPVDMYARIVEGDLDTSETARGINLETGKVESPGESAAEFIIESSSKIMQDGHRQIQVGLSFPGSEGEIAEVRKDDNYKYSTFKFPSTGTAEGLKYKRALTFVYDEVGGLVTLQQDLLGPDESILQNPDQSRIEGYVFEVANRYGKIYGPITLAPRIHESSIRTYVSISYAINGSIGEKSLEWNRRNLSTDQASIPAPQNP